MLFLKQAYFAVYKHAGRMVWFFCMSSTAVLLKLQYVKETYQENPEIPGFGLGRGMYSRDFWCCKCYIDFSNPVVEKQDREWHIHFRS